MRLWQLLLVVVIITFPAIGKSQATLPGPDKVPDRDEISAAIARFGEIPVIVTLAVAIHSEHELTGAEQAHQRQQIRQAQLAVRRALPPGALRAMREFQTMPLMRLVVTAETLQLLTTLPEVASVVEDRLSAPELATSVAQIHAPYLWRQGFTGSGQTIVVLDTGAETSHPLLADNIVAEACFSTTYAPHGSTSLCPGGVASAFTTGSSADCNTSIFGCGHGTHVAGIAAGRTSDRYGVAPEANIIPIQVFSRFDNPEFCGGADRSPCVLTYNSDQLAALEHVRLNLRFQHSIAAINMSLGGGLFTSACDNDQRAPIIADLRAAGIATVVASGNASSTTAISAPACISSAIAVGAVNASDQVASFSNSSSLIDLLAPGVSIVSARPAGTYAALSGTSMAAPHVSGAMALLRQQYPSDTVTQLLDRLVNSGVTVTDTRNGITKPRISLAQAPAAVQFAGNGGTGFGGPVGAGIISVRETAFGLELTLTRGSSGDFNDYLVVYADAGTGGFRSTAGLGDLGDTHRKAIRPPNHVLDFAPGFTATHAFVLNRQFGALWQLSDTGTHNFIGTGLAFESGRSASLATYTMTFPRDIFGQTPLQNLQFSLAAVYLNPSGGDSGNGFLSNEGLGRGLPGGATNVGGAAETRTALRSYFRYPDARQGGEALTQATGNWSSSATWLHGNPPLDRDSVVIAHSVEIDLRVHLGADADAARPGSITVKSGVSLHTGQDQLTYGEGAGIRFERQLTAPDFGPSRTGWWTAFASPVAGGSLAGENGILRGIPTQGFPGSEWPAASVSNVITWQNASSGSWAAPSANGFTAGRGYYAYLFELRDPADPASAVDYGSPLHITGPENAPGAAGFAFSGLAYNGAGANDSWNLLGNPFAAGLRWSPEFWEGAGVGAHAWIWDPVAGQHLVLAPDDEQIPGVTAPPVIAPFQAFWVRATGEGPSLRVLPSARTTDTANSARFRNSPLLAALVLEAVSGDISSRTALRFLPVGDDRLGETADFLAPVSSPSIQLYTREIEGSGDAGMLRVGGSTQAGVPTQLTSSTQYASSTQDTGFSRDAGMLRMLPAEGDRAIELGLIVRHSAVSEIIELRWDGLETLPEGMQILLIDRQTRNTTRLESDKTLRIEAGWSEDPRYVVRIIPASAASGEFVSQTPVETALAQNYPNPFNPTTRIHFTVGGQRCEGVLCDTSAEGGLTRLVVYDLLGREIAVLVNGRLPADSHFVNFDASALGSGVYVYRLSTGGQTITRKMTLIK